MRVVIVEDETLVAQRLERMIADILGSRITRLRVESTLDDAKDRLFSSPADLLTEVRFPVREK